MKTRLYFLIAMRALLSAAAMVPAAATLLAAEDGASSIERLQRTYDVERFKDVRKIEFTFHLQRGAETTERHWEWNLRKDEVALETQGPRGPVRHRYRRPALSKDPLTQTAEAWFSHDAHWLLFPYLLSRHKRVQIRDESYQTPPFGHALQRRLALRFPPEVKSGPGKTYELYLTEEGLVSEWVVRPNDKATLAATTWEDHKRCGPLFLSLTRRDPSGRYRVWFTDVRVR